MDRSLKSTIFRKKKQKIDINNLGGNVVQHLSGGTVSHWPVIT